LDCFHPDVKAHQQMVQSRNRCAVLLVN
jgi:hypothetical protein